MDQELAKAEKEVLVEIVKSTQKLGLKGSSGGWKEFLNRHDRKFGENIVDPAKRSTDILIAFLKTFTREEEQKMFLNILKRSKNQMAVLRRFTVSLEDETPLQRLIRLTIEHPKYMPRYRFPLHDEDWVTIPLGKVSKAMKCDSIIAVDCEMVLCEDGSDEVVQVCAVDQNLEVLVNMLIKPNKAVVDYRTHITGLSSEDLDGITCSLADVQKTLKKLLLHGTILAGHGLHNDLKVLKIHHTRVIDTSHIFKYENFDRITPSLNDLCKSVLGYELRTDGEPHDCLRDAEAVMKLVLAKLDRPIDNLADPAVVKVSDDHLKRLLLHKISVSIPYEELHSLFSAKYNVEFCGEFRRNEETYSTYVNFKDAAEAREAFLEIGGPIRKDRIGRPQKRVYMRLSTGEMTSIYVRGSFCNYEAVGQGRSECKQRQDLKAVNGKVVDDEIDCIVSSMKRDRELDHVDGPPDKRRHLDGENEDPQEVEDCETDKHGISLMETQKINNFGNDKCEISKKEETAAPCQCGHEKEVDRLLQELKQRDDKMSEIDRLRQLLKEREDEIFNLQKTVYDLTYNGQLES